LTNKFARRFVMLARVKIHTPHRYVQNKAQHWRGIPRPVTRRLIMGD
jgi:hypothetical protein